MINAEFEDLLLSVKPASADAFYETIYTKCRAVDLSAGAGLDLFRGLASWQQRQSDPVLQSYGFLYLSALLDSGQIEPTALPVGAIEACIVPYVEAASAHHVLSADGYFIHFMNHMTFFVGSAIEHMSYNYDDRRALVDLLLTIYLDARKNFSANEELCLAELILRANLSVDQYTGLLARLAPLPPSGFDGEWLIVTWQNSNRRNLAMVLHLLGQKVGTLPARAIADCLDAHSAHYLGAK